MSIDPSDWMQPGVDAIVNEIVSQAASGEGNVILLHDSGGDRSQTVAALPRIIETLQAKGYHFVTVSELLGQSRDAIMPPPSDRISTVRSASVTMVVPIRATPRPNRGSGTKPPVGPVTTAAVRGDIMDSAEAMFWP